MQSFVKIQLSRLRPHGLSSAVRREPLKYALAALLATVLATMWFQRGFVIGVYADEHDQVTLNLSGVDLTVERADLGPSPYLFEKAPDTGTELISLAFANSNASDAEIELLGGQSSIVGTVSENNNVVPGAIVRIERHTSRGSAFRDIRVSDSGRWGISDVLGGRYRIRAWVPGSHTMDESVVFLAEDDSKTSIDLAIREVQPQISLQSNDPVPIFDGSAGSVALGVDELAVDSEGFSTVRPVPGTVLEVAVLRPGVLLGHGVMLANSAGEVNFRVACEGTGPVLARVKIGDTFRSATVASCEPVPAPSVPPTVEAVPPNETPTREGQVQE